jgi:hypothetical protein
MRLEATIPDSRSLEWALSPEKLELPAEALARMSKIVEAAPRPSPRLRAAAGRQPG